MQPVDPVAAAREAIDEADRIHADAAYRNTRTPTQRRAAFITAVCWAGHPAVNRLWTGRTLAIEARQFGRTAHWQAAIDWLVNHYNDAVADAERRWALTQGAVHMAHANRTH